MNLETAILIINKLHRLFVLVPDYIMGLADFSYSQEAEDLILAEELSVIKKGFYVDIGACDPKRYSNTYRLYLRGWSGINIEPRPGSRTEFEKKRKRDINIEVGISKENMLLRYYQFNESALNSFSKEITKRRDGHKHYKIVCTSKVKTRPLKMVLNQHIDSNQKIDLMSIDVEGLEYEVVSTNDWNMYRPTYLIIEDVITKRSHLSQSPLYKYLTKRNYQLFASTPRTLFFKSSKVTK